MKHCIDQLYKMRMNPNPVSGRKSPHNRWRVRKVVDQRVDSQRSLIGLDGKNILFPEQKQFFPKQQALAWSGQRLKAD